MKKGLLTLGAALMMLAPMGASAAVRVAVGRPVVVARPYYYGGFYRPFWGAYWGPVWGPSYGYYYNPNSGEVKLETKVKDAEVFINGAFAGTTKENKTMHLRPGNYNIEIKEGGNTQFARNVYVTAGKTVKLYPEL